MKKELTQYQVVPGQQIKLKDFGTGYEGDLTKEEGKLILQEIKLKLSSYQERLYAENAHSVLIIFQAMDAAGKDSVISHVMSGLNPQGCQVSSFKTPTTNEYAHDFLWRHAVAMPQGGQIGIHNRSHYENVLIGKVHPEYILNEKIPGYDEPDKINESFWKKRYESIRNFEQHLAANGTVILKFFLYVSRDEQKKRFLKRIEDQAKNWKFSAGDIAERTLWKKYMSAYEEAINETAANAAPWYIVPADKKWYTRLIVSQVIEQTLTALNLQYPVLPEEGLLELDKCKKKLLDEDLHN